ncbi:hypothetical protein CLAFUW4_01770 [Fulvia fulva]|uniref:Uncharacterized protein n=1 Tax=Passalora fulva TaxID=5499 RepID=A0A9Q8P2P7_PASFU|nr:uncharacterized protein CLAFUR5_01766 [Fulvia fulva]KAK4635180.1 hypothetical protein CLAFUR4_01768 [Fulvia fulva]KAK4637616.1 hypothetical protein CLAFUR0_01770 [Fulvia fulva]UJO11160.1 hypothetical protein CLAFUR5_01766 [Fulvia fulva]WPV10032.1 hypothetical protein CLAFUW4_01770 [Fulvia fulva]WPV23117.1 hypothetical protein CLAFUW7_01772 [Fulvia fulva]
MAELRSISSGVQRRDFAAAPASATPTRDPATPQFRRGNPYECQYDYHFEDGNALTLAVFDWSCLEVFERLAGIEDAGQAFRGIMRVYVENCLDLVVDMDQLVAYELNQAQDQWMLTNELAAEFWSA